MVATVRNDPVQDQLGREMEDADEEPSEDNEVGQVIDGQAAERIDVARPVPANPLYSGVH